jgi:hypothetical protein
MLTAAIAVGNTAMTSQNAAPDADRPTCSAVCSRIT